MYMDDSPLWIDTPYKIWSIKKYPDRELKLRLDDVISGTTFYFRK